MEHITLITLFLAIVVLILQITILVRGKKDSENFLYGQNNPDLIQTEMSNGCYGACPGCQNRSNSELNQSVSCALRLSQLENSLQGDSIFEGGTGAGDDYQQDEWCCCGKNYKLSDAVLQNPGLLKEMNDARSFCPSPSPTPAPGPVPTPVNPRPTPVNPRPTPVNPRPINAGSGSSGKSNSSSGLYIGMGVVVVIVVIVVIAMIAKGKRY